MTLTIKNSTGLIDRMKEALEGIAEVKHLNGSVVISGTKETDGSVVEFTWGMTKYNTFMVMDEGAGKDAFMDTIGNVLDGMDDEFILELI